MRPRHNFGSGMVVLFAALLGDTAWADNTDTDDDCPAYHGAESALISILGAKEQGELIRPVQANDPILLRYSEQVDPTSVQVRLNKIDVTQLFRDAHSTADSALLKVDLPLEGGENLLFVTAYLHDDRQTDGSVECALPLRWQAWTVTQETTLQAEADIELHSLHRKDVPGLPRQGGELTGEQKRAFLEAVHEARRQRHPPVSP